MNFQNSVARASELEEQLRKIHQIGVDLHMRASQARLSATHPDLYGRLCELRDTLASHESSSNEAGDISETNRPAALARNDHSITHLATPSSPEANHQATVARPTLDDDGQDLECENCHQQLTASRGNGNGVSSEDRTTVPRPLGHNLQMTFAFHELDFSRRLQRYCLEYAFRLFTDARSPPGTTYRVFRLVACVRDREKTSPYFRELVTGGIRDRLELPNLPFYCVGGAGTHYPPRDDQGNPMYPSNMRLPRRILGCMPLAGYASPDDATPDQQYLLEMFGLSGQWFDCHDVGEYLRARGVCIEQSCVFPEVRGPLSRCDMSNTGKNTYNDNAGTNEQAGPLNGDPKSHMYVPRSVEAGPGSSTTASLLDLELFFGRKF